jgi:diacylglycerol kinase
VKLLVEELGRLIKRAKDAAAAEVLFAAATAIVIGFLVFAPHLLATRTA